MYEVIRNNFQKTIGVTSTCPRGRRGEEEFIASLRRLCGVKGTVRMLRKTQNSIGLAYLIKICHMSVYCTLNKYLKLSAN